MMGLRKIPNEAMKLSSDAAECTIFHGTMTHAPVIVMRIAARRRLMNFGNSDVRSCEQEMTFADTLTPIWATVQARPQKKAPARPPGPVHMEAMTTGSQMYSP